MTKSLLLEIGLEEVPARFVRGAMEQLETKLAKWLTDSRIAYESTRVYATPRRITVHVSGVAQKQADISEEVKGPSKKIALDDQGNWSKAAQGFARSQGVQEGDLYVKELAGVEYVFASKSGIGGHTQELLAEGLTALLLSMSFPKNMRWGANELKFVRPIRWLVALFGTDVIPLEITGVVAGRTSKGHRFLGQDIDIPDPESYVELLRGQHVIVDNEERQKMISDQINQLASDNGWTIAVKDDLLEEVLFLVEYPTALFGTFDPAFLHIPQEVLITSMREHQRYFPVLNHNGQLQPFFVTVRNGNQVSIDQVARGNEKVLRARLSDAKFFYEEDQKLQIETALAKLETIVFHEELGTIGDKVRRIEGLSKRIGELIGIAADQQKLVDRAAHISKFDLVTQMVYEFPELQGIMGEDYALKLGEAEAVAACVNEHYQPRFSGDQSPSSIIGAIVSIADKLDSISGSFSIGIIPTGSQDPYALRRQAAGVVQILLDYELPVTLEQLFEEALAIHQNQQPLKRDQAVIMKDLCDFFALRVKNVLTDKVRYDIVDAVMESGISHIPAVVRKAHAIGSFTAGEEAKSIVDAWTRVCNLAAKANDSHIHAELFVEQAERDLYQKWQSLHADYQEALEKGQEAEALQVLAGLRDPINAYFDAVMVMTDDLALRASRLALLLDISKGITKFADFTRIVW
jgi:glycyl-tRNA synthetase beta chain